MFFQKPQGKARIFCFLFFRYDYPGVQSCAVRQTKAVGSLGGTTRAIYVAPLPSVILVAKMISSGSTKSVAGAVHLGRQNEAKDYILCDWNQRWEELVYLLKF